MLGESCMLLAGGEGQNPQEGLSKGAREALPGTAGNQKGTRRYLSAGDTFRVVFSPPGWMLTPSGKLLPLLASCCLDYLGYLLQADVGQL